MKVKENGIVIIFILNALIFSSCKKDDTSDTFVFLGASYFPMQVGDSLIYDVHSHTMDAFGEADSSYQILERVESVFTDIEGRPTFRLERYVRSTPSDTWEIYHVWTANVTSVQVEKKEENFTFIKLAFPTQLNKKWNGNAKNILDAQDYKITDIHQPLSLNNLTYDSTLTVTQNEETLFIESHFAIEKYAAGVGMIFKQQSNYFFGNGSSDTTAFDEYSEILNYYN